MRRRPSRHAINMGIGGAALLLSLIAPSPCAAQGTPRSHRLLTAGLQAGVAAASLAPGEQAVTPHTGVVFGIYVAGASAVAWQIDGLVSDKGAEIGSLLVRAWYLEVPLSLRFNLHPERRTHGTIVAGVAPALKFSDSVGGGLRAYDVSALIGIGVESHRWTLGARYTRGLVDTHLEINGVGHQKNQTVSVLFGVRLR